MTKNDLLCNNVYIFCFCFIYAIRKIVILVIERAAPKMKQKKKGIIKKGKQTDTLIIMSLIK